MDMSRLMGVVRAFLLLVCAAVISPSSFGSTTCPTNFADPPYNGYCIDGIRPGGYPHFETGVSFEWKQTDSSLSATKDNGVDPLFHVSPTESYAITNLSVDFSAVLTFTNIEKTQGTATGSIDIFGHIVGLSIDENPAPLLMSADLEGDWAQDTGDKSLIGFNTMNIVCHADLNTFLGGGGCTTNESLYFDLDEPIDFAYLGKNGKGKVKTKTDGVAIATVPVPPAVWLFGSGLLGLVGIARRKKAA